jgi:hypothetical protein
MKALISPSETPVYRITGWTQTIPMEAIYEAYPNSCRVAQVEPNDQIFEVASPLFWVDCADNVIGGQFYYDEITKEILPIVNADAPEKIAAPNQPSTSGTQTA